MAPVNANPDEHNSLLPHSHHPTPRMPSRSRLTRFTANPSWLVPVVMVMSISRGITMAPRIKAYTDIACRELGNASSSLLDCPSSSVQGRAAKLQASVVTIMSVLSAISTGPWSRLGDVKGRKPILCLSLFGALAMDVAFIIVSNPNTVFGQNASYFLLVGPILDGFVGGLSAFNGVVHAYISDCTPHGSRSKIFSAVQGVVFVGLAIGPWIGGLLFRAPWATNVSLFYLSASFLLIIFLYVALVCPESRLPVQSPRPEHAWVEHSQRRPAGLQLLQQSTIKFLKALISPVAMFAPRPNPRSRLGRDYNLTFLGLALFMYLVSTGLTPNKYLYAQHIFSWTTQQLGYYMSLLWITRAFNLLIFLPIIISYFKPKVGNAYDDPVKIASELRFDKLLAGCSMSLDGFSNLMIAITPTTSEISFVGFSTLTAFTSGGSPALHSLGAVCLHATGNSSEVGTLFGALAVLSAVAHIISPSIYAFIYSSTVATVPQAIFYMASALLFSGVLLLGGIRPSSQSVALDSTPLLEDERSLSRASTDSLEPPPSPIVV